MSQSRRPELRVERVNLTLQDRLVKELRLRKIGSREAANEFAPHFIADFNVRFAKPAQRDHDAHRPVRTDEDLDLIFSWRVQRKVSRSLTLQHDRIVYLLENCEANLALIHRYIDVYEYPWRVQRRSPIAHAPARQDRLPARELRGQPRAHPPLHRRLRVPDGEIEIRADARAFAMSATTGSGRSTPAPSSRTSGWATHCA
jgi:hypothetical protein